MAESNTSMLPWRVCRSIVKLLILVASFLALSSQVFSLTPSTTSSKRHSVRSETQFRALNSLSDLDSDGIDGISPSRRKILASCGAAALSTMFSLNEPAHAVPVVTVDEFAIILRDSPLSVTVVEFSGPKSENVVVKLVDGTTFGIKDIVESSTDPRSPLKLSAACRESGVKTKFVDLEAMLASNPNKKKMYTNQRVRDAQEKEKERLERIRQDEEQRLAQLAEMEKLESQ